MKKYIEVYVACKNEHFSHDYNISSNDSESNIIMKRSMDSMWYNPGETVATVTEKDNLYDIKIGKKKITFDYGELMELYVLLGSILVEEKIEYRESKVIKSI